VDLKLIVNADDVGISDEVNDAVFSLIARRRISSATIMANAPATVRAGRQAASFPWCSFGAHLNLTEFEPLTRGPGARLLVNEHGQMSRAIMSAAPSLERLRAVFDELCAQVERLASCGIRISHLDSHHHVHTKALVFPVLKEIQRRYGIRRVRLSKNFYGTDRPCTSGLLLRKQAYNWALRSIYRTKTTDAFTEFLTYWRAGEMRKQSVGVIELMVHPGARSADEEREVLESDWIRKAAPGARLLSYAQLD
jgi:hypothetical protein